MQPIGLLMIEHRLIERMIPILDENLQKIKETNTLDSNFLIICIDFFKTYADKIHHGKEEDILFKALEKIQISKDHKKTLEQLLRDHRTSRTIIGSLEEANNQFCRGDKSVLNDIQEKIHQLTVLYPQHIEIEDKQFFFPIMDYFTREECDNMIREFFDFDKNIIHKYYNQIVEKQEKLFGLKENE